MGSFLEYLVFFEAVFFTEQLEMICGMDFDMFFGIFIFDPKSGFCMGYSLSMMGDFQNGLISGIFSVFLRKETILKIGYHAKAIAHLKS